MMTSYDRNDFMTDEKIRKRLSWYEGLCLFLCSVPNQRELVRTCSNLEYFEITSIDCRSYKGDE